MALPKCTGSGQLPDVPGTPREQAEASCCPHLAYPSPLPEAPSGLTRASVVMETEFRVSLRSPPLASNSGNPLDSVSSRLGLQACAVKPGSTHSFFLRAVA